MNKLSFFYISFCSALCVLLFSCSSTKNLNDSNSSVRRSSKPKFLGDIMVQPGEKTSANKNSYGYSHTAPPLQQSDNEKTSDLNATDLQLKYAPILETTPLAINASSLLSEIDNWYGTPYRMGGTSKNGIDCSAFCRLLIEDNYNIELPRTAQEQYEKSTHIDKSDLKQGDLVFFHTTGGRHITHVGVYLQNNKFAHASTSGGVMISDLDEPYWRKTYRSAGRIKNMDAGLTTN